MKGHRTDGVSLTFAVIFLAVAAWWLAAQLVHLELPAVGWIVASALILLGMFGLLGALRSGRYAASAAETGTTTPDAAPSSGTPAEPTSGSPHDATACGPAGGVEPLTAPPDGTRAEGPA